MTGKRERIDRREGRRLFGSDPVSYDFARPGHAARVYDVLVQRCGLGPSVSVLEIGPGTGQATRRLLELGADPLVALEPDPALAEYLRKSTDCVDVRLSTLEEAELEAGAFDLAVAASSFHWVDEPVGLAVVHAALGPGRWFAMWWTLFGYDASPDAFMRAVDHLFLGLPQSPSHGEAGRPYFAVDAEARVAALEAAGFRDVEHEIVTWKTSWNTRGIRALYGTFSPIASLDERRRTQILDAVATVAERDFGGRVERVLRTSLYTARKPA